MFWLFASRSKRCRISSCFVAGGSHGWWWTQTRNLFCLYLHTSIFIEPFSPHYTNSVTSMLSLSVWSTPLWNMLRLTLLSWKDWKCSLSKWQLAEEMGFTILFPLLIMFFYLCPKIKNLCFSPLPSGSKATVRAWFDHFHKIFWMNTFWIFIITHFYYGYFRKWPIS